MLRRPAGSCPAPAAVAKNQCQSPYPSVFFQVCLACRTRLDLSRLKLMHACFELTASGARGLMLSSSSYISNMHQLTSSSARLPVPAKRLTCSLQIQTIQQLFAAAGAHTAPMPRVSHTPFLFNARHLLLAVAAQAC